VTIWRQNVANTLQGGKASIWQISPRQLQVVIAWQANENTNTVLSNTGPAAAALQVAPAMQINAAAAGNTCNANSNTICHIDFIDIPPNM
jgi:hypothetical protein